MNLKVSQPDKTALNEKSRLELLLLTLLGLLLSACGVNTPETQLTTQAVTPRVEQYQSFQVTTPGLTDRFMSHRDYLGYTSVVSASSPDLLKNDTTWKVVRGLADANCYSLESKNYPGYFLRHQASRVRLDRNDTSVLFRRDATWCGRDGLSGTGISFESKNFPGRYLRHYNAELWLAQKGGGLRSDAAAGFEQDVSWNIYDPWASGNGDGGGGDNGGNNGGGGVTLPPAPAGRINFRVLNQTNGAYPDNQVYWAILGYNPATRALSYINRSGNLVAASPADNTAPGSLSKNGKNYANYFNRVSDLGTFTLPKMYGARIFLSVGSPMFIEILGAPGGVGFAGPDINNPSDPNQDVFFDFGEFTYNDIGFFGNNTRVDQFGFPVRLRLVGDGGSYDEAIGENVSRAQIFSDFANLPQTEFRSLARPPYRIVAPKAGVFGRGGSQANYFQGYIDQIWESYRSRDLVLTNDAGVFRGRVQGDNFVFSQDGGPSGLVLERPDSIMVFEANGAFDKGNSLEKVIGAQVAAAINRHVVVDVDPSRWADDSRYYRNAPANFYADFWHKRSIGGKAYGFAYDDVFSKATLLQNPNPLQVDFIVGW